MTNVFGGQSYATREMMLDAIAGEYLTAGGSNDETTVQDILAHSTDLELASDCTEGWGLSMAGVADDGAASHMETENYGMHDLAAAFGRARQMPRVSAGVDDEAG